MIVFFPILMALQAADPMKYFYFTWSFIEGICITLPENFMSLKNILFAWL